jgi:uroporphyrinogen decarboxylase
LLIPLFTEAGINLMLPFEVQAGMDVREVRKQFPRLVIQGGLEKHALAISKEAIDAELEAKLPFMLNRRGYITSLDHVVPPDVPYSNWLYYLDRVRNWKS